MPQVMATMHEKLPALGEVNTIDGLRVQFERGWGLIRTSNTEPVLSMRFEGETEADAHHYRDLFFDILRADIDLSQFDG
jgi:phosphomannomutase